MGTFPLSSIIQSSDLISRTNESINLVSATHITSKKRVAQSLWKMNGERNVAFEGVARSSKESSSQEHRLNVLITSRSFVLHAPEKIFKYLFRSEIGGHVKVHVEMKSNKYSVYVEISSLQLLHSEDELLMIWGLYRSDSSSFMPIDFQNPSLTSANTTETLLLRKSSGHFVLEITLEANLAPFYFSFILKSVSSEGSRISEIRSHRNTSFCVPVGFSSGYPAPLGLSFSADGSMNFSLFSRSAERVILCLYSEAMNAKPALQIDLDPYVNRTGDIWHASINTATPLVSYGYKCMAGTKQKGETVLLDPYAKIIGDTSSGLLPWCLGQLQEEPEFDWTGDVRPFLPLEKLVVYRLNIMRFTKDKSSMLANDIGGTFSGISQKLQHFKDLGVNAILLEPVFPFDDQQGPYFPYHFFSPAKIYGNSSVPRSTIWTMKEMVKRLHANGIEVIMEVVFTHTADIGSLKEIDNSSYHYVKAGDGGIHKDTLNCNFPVVQQMILDSLRHWVIEFHIDGFCFINAGSLLRGCNGENLLRPPLVEAIAFDPILSKVKLIADSWDPHDAESKPVLFPHWKRWAEVNTEFCEDVRNYLRGEGLLSHLATRLCGSGDKFSAGRGPAFSFNFIARNSGLSLVDMVSFSGTDLVSELSWNCGVEGATTDTTVLETRLKQIRNFLFILFVSLGVPVLNMGDECGQSCGGSPAYSDRKPLNWNSLKTDFGIQTRLFISFLSSLRTRRSDLLQRKNFLQEENIDWCGTDLNPPNWEDPKRKYLAMIIKVYKEEIQPTSSLPCPGNIFIAFNAADHSESIVLPPTPTDMEWLRLVDTALSYPGFFSLDGDPVFKQIPELVYEMKSHSCVLFEARQTSG